MVPRKISIPLPEWSALIGILLVGAFLRLYQLEYKSLWVDEIGQVVAAQGTLWEAIRGAAQHVAAPPLDYVVTWSSLRLANTEFVLRFAPAAWGILAIAAGYALARRLTRSRRVALVTAGLLAGAPLLVRYAQEVRFYALAVFLTLVCVYAFVRAREQPVPRRWFGFTLALVAAFYAHYYIVFVVVACGAWMVLVQWTEHDARSARRARALGFGAALLVLGCCAAPWLLFAGRGDPGEFVFVPPEVGAVLADPVVGVNIDPDGRRWLTLLGMLVLPGLALAGLVSLWRKQRRAALLVGMLLLTGVSGVLAGDFVLHYFYTPRQLLFLVPYYLMACAVGIVSLVDRLARRRRIMGAVAVGATVGIALVFAMSLRGYYDWVKDDWRSTARLLANAQAQSIATEPPTLGTYLAYYRPDLYAALQQPPAERLWVVTLDTTKPHILEQGSWSSIRLDTSPTVNVFYAGHVPEVTLQREVAAMELPPQVLIYSDLLTRLQATDLALARQVAERGQQALPELTPPLLDGQRTRLLRRLSRLE